MFYSHFDTHQCTVEKGNIRTEHNHTYNNSDCKIYADLNLQTLQWWIFTLDKQKND